MGTSQSVRDKQTAPGRARARHLPQVASPKPKRGKRSNYLVGEWRRSRKFLHGLAVPGDPGAANPSGVPRGYAQPLLAVISPSRRAWATLEPPPRTAQRNYRAHG